MVFSHRLNLIWIFSEDYEPHSKHFAASNEKFLQNSLIFYVFDFYLKLRHAVLLFFVVQAALAQPCILANKRINHSLPYH